MVALAEKLQYLYPASVPHAPGRFGDWGVTSIAGTEVIVYWNTAIGAQPTQTTLDAVTQAQVDAAALAKLYVAAKALMTADAPSDKRWKALVLVLLDELNLIRSKLSPPLPARTIAQLRTVIGNKIDAGQADG